MWTCRWFSVLVLMALLFTFAAAQSYSESSQRKEHSDVGKPRGGASSTGSRVTLRAVNIFSDRDGTRVEMTSTGPIAPTVTKLTSPDRLVLDFPNTVSAGHQDVLAVNHDGVKSVRIGVQPSDPPITRVVVDLLQPRTYELASANKKTILKLGSIGNTREATAIGSALEVSSVTEGSGTAASSGQEVRQQKPTAGGPPPDNEKPESQQTVNQVLPSTGQGTEPETPANGSNGEVSRPAAGIDVKAAPTNQPLPNTAANPGSSDSAVQPLPTVAEQLGSSVQMPGSVPSIPARSATEDELVIGPDDVLAINVWKEPEVSQTVAVRPDGKISLPLVGDVEASGLTPKQLQATITLQLGNYLSRPEVTVIVHEVKSRRVVVAGEIAKPGTYVLQTPMTVLDAIAGAGGPLEYAKVKSIYVLRMGPDGRPIRLHFNYKEVIKGRNLAQNIRLQPHDTIVVP
jgi:polysaccharide biosynthesis/export protein